MGAARLSTASASPGFSAHALLLGSLSVPLRALQRTPPNHPREALSLAKEQAPLGKRDGFPGQRQETHFLASVGTAGMATITGKARVSAEAQGLTAAACRELEPTVRTGGWPGHVLPAASGRHARKRRFGEPQGQGSPGQGLLKGGPGTLRSLKPTLQLWVPVSSASFAWKTVKGFLQDECAPGSTGKSPNRF